MIETLSDREQQVAAMLSSGRRVPAVAEELCISPVTVRNHLRNIFAKLDVHSQTDLIRLLERQPEILGAHRPVPGVGGSSLVDDLGEADHSIRNRIEAAFARSDGLEAMKSVIRAVLPLDEARRREWRTRLAAHAISDQQREVREAFSETRRAWAKEQSSTIASLQERGWVRDDVDPDDVRRRLLGAVLAAAVALLADPSEDEQQRQLATIDDLLTSLAREDAGGA